MTNRPIALLTDFGNSTYVGVMKGAIIKHHPDVSLIDLTHEVASQNVREGAWLLFQAYSFFPKETVFLAVVDPGVGGVRSCLAIKSTNYFFVGPDNGLLYPAASDDGILEVVNLEVSAKDSTTFHGRDVFAPASAMISKGDALNNLGTSAKINVELYFKNEGNWGEVVHLDHFGNIVTSIPCTKSCLYYGIELHRSEEIIYSAVLPLNFNYESAQQEDLFLIRGSAGTFEISRKNSRAVNYIPAVLGDLIRISPAMESCKLKI